MKRRVFAALLSLVLVLGVVPSAAFAEYGADAEGSAVETDQMDSGAQNGQDSDPDQIPGGDAVPDPDGEDDAVQDPAPGSEPESPDENGDAGDPEGDKTPEEEPEELKLTLPEATASLQAISGRDEEGQLKIYTTLYDEKQRIIDTNDPDEEQSAYYKNGGTVARGAGVYVHIRMAEILPNDGESGVQENVTYFLDQLPRELIPAEEDRDGNQVLNPEEPAAFFQTAGDVTAYGGIYGENGTYAMKVFFQNVADSIDISGVFSYGANISDTLTPGETYELKTVPGGTLRFKVTPEIPPVPEGEGYTLYLGGGSGGPTAYYWNVQIARNQDEKGAELPYRDLTITTEDAMGVWVSEDDFTIFNGYGDGYGPGFSLGVTYTTEDEDGKLLNDWISATKDDIIRNSDGATTVRFTSEKEHLQVDVTFRREDAVPGTCTQYNGRYSYITNTIRAEITDGAGGFAEHIASLQLYVPTISYDDYQRTGNVSYKGTAWLDATDKAERLDMTIDSGSSYRSSYINVSYNDLGQPSASDSPQSPTSSYGFLPETVYTYLQTNSSSYRGNYYWADFQPNVTNTTNANYYLSNRSFLGGNQLISTNGQEATFSPNYGGTRVSGMVGYFGDGEWQFAGTVSVAQVQGDENLVANSSCFSQYSADDVKLQYQLKKVFSSSDYSGSGQLVVYRTSRPHSYGEYIYLIIDPHTNEIAERNKNNNWYEQMENHGSSWGSDDLTAKPAGWRIHVFNAPCTGFDSSMFRSLGAFRTDDQNGGGSMTDQFRVGIAAYNGTAVSRSQTAGCGITRYQNSYMNAQWVSEDTIFWSMTFDATNWPSWNTGTVYVKMDRSLSPLINGSSGYALLEGQQVDVSKVYVRDPNSSQKWAQLNVPESGSSSMSSDGNPSSGNIDKLVEYSYLARHSSSLTYNSNYERAIYFAYSDSSMTQYRDPSTKDITIGFFTKATGTPNANSDYQSYYSCTAEFTARTGDISRYAGNGGSSWPASATNGSLYQMPIRITASARADVPQLYKNGSAAEGDSSKTVIDWSVQPVLNTYPVTPNGPIINVNYPQGFYGGYNGLLTIADGMSAAAAKDINGTELAIKPGAYTHITRMFCNSSRSGSFSISELGNGSGCGPIPFADSTEESGYWGDTTWERYVDGQWKHTGKDQDGNYILWNPTEPGIYRAVLNSSGTNSQADPLAVYVYYAGNMADSVRSTLGGTMAALGLAPQINDSRYDQSLVVEFQGLHYASTNNNYRISPVTYVTEMDNRELLDAMNKDKTEDAALTALYDLSLSNAASCGMWNRAGKTPASATVAKRMSALLSIEKTAHAIPKSAGQDAYTGSYTLSVVNGLTPTGYVEVEDFVTGFVNVRRDNGDTITPIENGTFESDEDIRTLVRYLDLLDDVSIGVWKNGRLSETIYRDGAFTDAWKDSVFLPNTAEGYTSEKPGSLFQAVLKRADGSEIDAGTEFVISYRTKLNMDQPLDGEEASLRQSRYYLGEGMQIFNNAQASRTYTPVTSVSVQTARAAAHSEELKLTVDCGGSVGSVYLAKTKLYKTLVGSGSANPLHWMYYAYTGTMGKGQLTIPLDDYLSYQISAMTFTEPDTNEKVDLKNLPEAEQVRIKMVMEQLVERHMTYSNIKLYYTETMPTTSGSNLSAGDLLWDLGSFTVSGGTEITGGRATAEGLKDLTLGAAPDRRELTWTGTGDRGGITLTLTGVPASMSQQDGELEHGHLGFRVEAEGLDRQMYLAATYDVAVDWDAVYAEAQKIFGNYSCKGQLANEVSDDTGEKEDKRGNVIAIEDATLRKSVSNVRPAVGTADWTLSAYTGSKSETRMTLEDTISVTLPEGTEERVRTAAEAATYIDPASVKVWCNNQSIYYLGSYRGGWTQEDLSITVEGRHLSITVQGSKLAPKQSYTVTYSSALDKGVFLENGGKSQDTYTLQNAAALGYGDLTVGASASGSFKPDLPISASKKCDQTLGNLARWTAAASTGAGRREDFTLADKLSAADSSLNSRLIAAMMLQSMEITVKTGEEEAVFYTPDTLPEGAVLTALDGSALPLEQLGFEGFRLSFAQLPANTTVTVKYTTALDRETFGSDGTFTIRNTLNAASADGAAAGGSASGRVEVKKPFEKKGAYLSTTEDGRTMLRWTLNVNLTEKFTQSQLDKMKEAVITDDLNPVLRLDMSSVSVKDAAGNLVPVTAQQIGTRLIVRLPDPGQHPSVTLTFRTECLAAVDGLVNQAELSIDGVTADRAESPDIGKIPVNGQYGTIQSAKPVFTPEARKFVDNEPCTEAGRYSFTLTEVADAEGTPMANAYTETMTNDAEGWIRYSQIKYKSEGTHYYQVKETGADTLDTRVFLLRVDVVKLAKSSYLISSTILTPENYSDIRFDNTTKPKTTDFTVTKVWEDNGNAADMRPDSIVVHLYQGDEPYNNMTVTLNAGNNWTYTWEDLPVAGGEYRAVEDPVPGYAGTAVTEDGRTVLTNTATAGRLTISKTVSGTYGETDRDFTFTIILTDEEGTPLEGTFAYSGSKTGTIASGETVTLRHGQSITLDNLPAGTRYQVTETPAEGYDTTVSNGSGVIEAGRRQTAAFANQYGADKPGNGELTIRKTVTGSRGDHSRQFTFAVTLADALGRPLTDAYPYSGSKSGTIISGETITLKDGESVTITGLPDGARYQVEELEANADGYTTSAAGASGVVEKDGTAEAAFVNHKPGSHSGTKKTELTVVKQWAGSGSHPASVLVQLLRDGEPYGDPVRLQAENGWTYTWTGLSKDSRWTVSETVPEGYQASVSYAGTVWTITNTPDAPDQPEVPDQPDQPDLPVTPDTPDIPDTPAAPDNPAVPDRTPKTGDEAHPAFWIALLGVSLAGRGGSLAVMKKRRYRNKHVK